MNIIWLGHGSWRIEIGGEVLLIDPWISNPVMPEDRREEAVQGATQILITHGHFDHTVDIVEVSKTTGAPVSGMYELANHLFSLGATEGNAFNKGGTNVAATEGQGVGHATSSGRRARRRQRARGPCLPESRLQ